MKTYCTLERACISYWLVSHFCSHVRHNHFGYCYEKLLIFVFLFYTVLFLPHFSHLHFNHFWLLLLQFCTISVDNYWPGLTISQLAMCFRCGRIFNDHKFTAECRSEEIVIFGQYWGYGQKSVQIFLDSQCSSLMTIILCAHQLCPTLNLTVTQTNIWWVIECCVLCCRQLLATNRVADTFHFVQVNQQHSRKQQWFW